MTSGSEDVDPLEMLFERLSSRFPWHEIAVACRTMGWGYGTPERPACPTIESLRSEARELFESLLAVFRAGQKANFGNPFWESPSSSSSSLFSIEIGTDRVKLSFVPFSKMEALEP
jgi:hypothetical protein